METKESLTAEAVALKLRIWRMTHRSHVPVSELEKEIGIPAKRMQRCLLNRDNLPDYREHIIRFLDAFEGKDEQMLRVLQENQPTELPPPHHPASYSPAVFSEIKGHQRATTRNDERPHCLIANQRISPRQCVARQNAKDCYGCAADTRFCAECGYDRIAFPMSELCSFCLTKALRDPSTDKLLGERTIHVACHFSGGRQITAATCRRMQSEGCGKCAAITRFCLECKERRVRYPEFGLCLHCHVDTWGLGSWEPMDDETFAQTKANREAYFDKAAAVAQIVPLEETKVLQMATPSDASEPEDYSVAMMHALKRVWQAIRQHHPDVPGVLLLPGPITVVSQEHNSPYRKPIRWRARDKGNGLFHELLITAEYMDQPAEDIMEALLHEAAHAANAIRGVKDCSTSEYHNKRFRDTAQELGLEAQNVPNYGFADTRLPSETAVDYAEVIEGLRIALEHCRTKESAAQNKEGNRKEDLETSEEMPKRPNRSCKAVCQCGFIIRVSVKTLGDTVIRCETCGEPFHLV